MMNDDSAISYFHGKAEDSKDIIAKFSTPNESHVAVDGMGIVDHAFSNLNLLKNDDDDFRRSPVSRLKGGADDEGSTSISLGDNVEMMHQLPYNLSNLIRPSDAETLRMLQSCAFPDLPGSAITINEEDYSKRITQILFSANENSNIISDDSSNDAEGNSEKNEEIDKVVAALKSDFSKDKKLIASSINQLENLSETYQYLDYMGSRDLGLIPLLISIILETDEETKVKSLNCLTNIAELDKNNEYMGSKDLGLISVLMAIISKDVGEARENALNCLRNITSVDETGDFTSGFEYIGSKELGLITLLMSVISTDEEEAVDTALDCLSNIASFGEDTIEYMGSKELGLTQLLKSNIWTDEGKLNDSVFCCLTNYLSNRSSMGSDELSLIPSLVLVISKNKGRARDSALKCLDIISSHEECLTSMGSKELGLVPLLISIISKDKSDARKSSISCLYSIMLLYANIPYVVENHGLSVIMNVIRSTDAESSLNKTCLTAIMVACRHPIAALFFTEAFGLRAVVSYVKDRKNIGFLQAAFIVSFIVGEDETRLNNQLSFIQKYPDLYDSILSVFTNTVNGQDGLDYQFGDFDLNVIVASIKSISLSDSNKEIMVTQPILEPLLHLLSAFIKNSSEIKYKGTRKACNRAVVGGGGGDIESAESAIGIILQLSLFYESDIDLRIKYFIPELKIKEILELLLLNDKICEDSKRNISILLNRLEEKVVPVGSPLEFIRSTVISVNEDGKRH